LPKNTVIYFSWAIKLAKNKREDKKKPAMTPKEKKAAKRTKKEGKLAASA
jgi:hypothetical protein